MTTQPTPEQLDKWREAGAAAWMVDSDASTQQEHEDCYIAGYLRAKQETEQVIKDARKQALEEALAICNGAVSFPDAKYYISDKLKELLND